MASCRRIPRAPAGTDPPVLDVCANCHIWNDTRLDDFKCVTERPTGHNRLRRRGWLQSPVCLALRLLFERFPKARWRRMRCF